MKGKKGVCLSTKLYLVFNYSTLLLGLFLILASSCEKDDRHAKIPDLITTFEGIIDETSATSGGVILNDGGANIKERGVCWGTELNPDINTNQKTLEGTGIGEFSSLIIDLIPNTTYHIRAYATNAAGTAYGEDISFNTTPSVITSQVTSITADSAFCGGNVIGDGSVLIIDRGICWSKDHNPTTSNSKRASDSTGTGLFQCKLSYLSPMTTYYVRSYATNPAGTSYGNEVSFTTKAQLPYVSTNYPSNITATTASSGGYSSTNAMAPIIVQGVCWDTVPRPTVDLDTKTANGNSQGSFTSNIGGLSPETKYYVRAYATNSGGTGYGNEYYFTTTTYPPVLTTTAVSSITGTSAISGGNITDDMGSTVTSRGVCWSTVPNPTKDLYTRTSNGTGIGSYTSSISGLSAGTTYYVRAYATNNGGTAYGNEYSFTTNVVAPTVTTTVITSTTTTSSISGGNISNDGGAAVISRGVCWGTSSNPTISLPTKTSDGSGTGSFSSAITSLTANTLYYVRAYATNSAGTAYGDEVLLKTYTGTVYDVDGNLYNTVTIGTQVWMVENLKVTKYNDGTDIPNVSNNSSWSSTISPAYCWYNNSSSYKATYGALYN